MFNFTKRKDDLFDIYFFEFGDSKWVTKVTKMKTEIHSGVRYHTAICFKANNPSKSVEFAVESIRKDVDGIEGLASICEQSWLLKFEPEFYE